MKTILITGRNSYVGNALENWLTHESNNYLIDKISLKNPLWKEHDFTSYEVVFHVAGIAHVSTDPKMREKYYHVNRDLSIEAAKKARAEGVNQFIFMSSIIVYGESTNNAQVIDKDTAPAPSNFYGDSKLEAEKGIKALETENFKVVILRPPMIYGKGSKGNYPRLARLALKTPVFPDFYNQRSMLHIDNLCAFVKAMIDEDERGLYFPQNKEYVNTSELVQTIAEVHNKRIVMTKLFNPLLRLISGLRIVNKVFGDLVYNKSMSEYDKVNYQIRTFRKSIELTELERENR